MSRIGKLPVSIPAITITNEDGVLEFKRSSEKSDVRAKHGLSRSLVANMIEGVSEGFKTVQEFVGVGYKVEVKGQVLDLALGFSHHLFFQLPPEVTAEAVSERGKNPILTLKSYDKQLLGQVGKAAAK